VPLLALMFRPPLAAAGAATVLAALALRSPLTGRIKRGAATL